MTLSAAQHAILAYALEHTEGRIIWLPPKLRGGALTQVLEAMRNRELIAPRADAPEAWEVAPAGYAAMGQTMPETAPAPARRTRDNSKQAAVIALLKRPEGATIGQICEATGWQAHTVRGTFAGAFKKKLGLTLTSEKATGQERVYHIV